MRTILKWRWAVLALWIALAAGLMLLAPDMQQLVREKGQITVPDGYSSSTASKLLKEKEAQSRVAGDAGDEKSAVLVFHRDEGLSDADRQEIRSGLAELKGKGSLGIASVTGPFDRKELEDQLVAKDGRTMLALVSIEADGKEPQELQSLLVEAASTIKVEHYYTSEWMINEDQIRSSMEGLAKTEYITVVFILVILFLVFRSAVAPFVPLVVVGLSYLLSQSVVAFLAEYAGFPLSTFTQIFMVAILFGIGTDYCILLISRYKEELASGLDRTEAIVRTYRNAGRTVLISGLAVLIGFASIGFSTFGLYRSAVAVAVGVAVLLLALVTLVPFFMAVLGNALFWPQKGSLSHSDSRLWGRMGRFSLRRPVWALLVLAVVAVPLLLSYRNAISFNSMEEIGDKYDSVKAFNLISDSFGPGDSMPSTVVLRADKSFDGKEGLAALEQVSRELAKVPGVKSVRSATRPAGEPLQELEVASQAGTLESGIDQSTEGLDRIGQGLSEASSSLAANAPKLEKAAAGAGELEQGTARLQGGVKELEQGLRRIQQGLQDGSVGAKELSAGLKQAQGSAVQLAEASDRLLQGYREAAGGLNQLHGAYERLAASQRQLAQGLGGVQQAFGALAEKYPELGSDEQYQAALQSLAGLQGGAEQAAAGLEQANAQLAGAAAGIGKANGGLEQASAGQAALGGGLRELAAGLDALQKGIQQAADGQGQAIGKLPQVAAGFEQLQGGQRQLSQGFAELNEQLGQLTSGLDQSVDGISRVSGGLAEAKSYLTELSKSPSRSLTGWNLPDAALQDESFRQAVATYLSPQGTMATLDVVFDSNPYEEQTLRRIPELEAAIERGLEGTAYAGAQHAIGGITSVQHDLNTISQADYSRTVVLMMAGISLILIALFRSLVIPAYIMASLLLTYYTSMAAAEAIFSRALDYSGISWPVPFFSFVLLIALGVDYSIFLLDRFREYRHLPPQEAILLSMRHMGSVILSAAVILGGTFAAMLPSGVLSLMQIATVVLIGLLLYAVLILPLFIPVMVRLFGAANWWPFMGGREEREQPLPAPAPSLTADR
ncbi:MMPL family transporter [Paenibacillus sp. FSL W8-1187]|uniref:MMPL family transporter n=1 Tax=Paenibacillus sp. FSL W8-1187 TaxID=2975339 RepID=UPI0030DD1C50